MATRTSKDYIESLKKQSPKVYMAGEEVKDVVADPFFKVGINSVAATYDAAGDPELREWSVTQSSLINEEISVWTHIFEDEKTLINKVKLLRGLGDRMVTCCYRCIGSDMINAVWATTYDIDQKYNTNYHQKFIEIVKDIQKNDLAVGCAVVDPKGDRKLRPAEQEDPDMYLRVVDKRKDGIVVRGAKLHSTAAPYMNVLLSMPSTILQEDEKDYAVCFFTPVDAEGITLVSRPSPIPSEPKELENPLSSRIGGHVEANVIFDDVFVPWEMVLMCGESEFSVPLMSRIGSFHIQSKCGCGPATTDLSIGAAALIADLNGVETAPHIQDKIAEMIMNAEIVFSCGISGAVRGEKHESGVYIPMGLPGFAGKIFNARKLGENRFFMQDIAGGITGTMPTEKDYRSEKTGQYMEKFYKGRKGVSTEDRIRASKLIEDLTKSPFAGWYHAIAISGGGASQGLKEMLKWEYDLEKSKEKAKKAARIIK